MDKVFLLLANGYICLVFFVLIYNAGHLLLNKPDMDEKRLEKEEEHFVPVGTIVFITLLLALTALIWFSLYNLQLERHY